MRAQEQASGVGDAQTDRSSPAGNPGVDQPATGAKTNANATPARGPEEAGTISCPNACATCGWPPQNHAPYQKDHTYNPPSADRPGEAWKGCIHESPPCTSAEAHASRERAALSSGQEEAVTEALMTRGRSMIAWLRETEMPDSERDALPKEVLLRLADILESRMPSADGSSASGNEQKGKAK